MAFFVAAFLTRIKVSDNEELTGDELRRKLKRYADRNGLRFEFDVRQGKGSHGTLYVGDKRTTLPRGELAAGTLAAILKQLGIDRKEI